MKFETLINRYKNLGYEPKNIDSEVEIECLINWIYKKYDIFINVMHNDSQHIKSFKKVVPEIDRFVGCKIYRCSTENSEKFYTDKYFNNPFDCKFHTLVKLYKVIKFKFN